MVFVGTTVVSMALYMFMFLVMHGGGGLPEDEEEAEDSLSDVCQRSEEV